MMVYSVGGLKADKEIWEVLKGGYWEFDYCFTITQALCI